MNEAELIAYRAGEPGESSGLFTQCDAATYFGTEFHVYTNGSLPPGGAPDGMQPGQEARR